MIGLDTDIIVRLLTADDAEQTDIVIDFLARNDNTENPPFIADLVLAETVWVLETRYGLGRNQIAAGLRRFVLNVTFVFESEERILEMIETYQRTKVDFADLLIAESARRAGCSATLSFDRTAIRAGIMEPIAGETA